MQIKVRTLTGKEIELDIESDYKVLHIKDRLAEKEGIPPEQQRLIYGGKQMADEKTAADYSLEGGGQLMAEAQKNDMVEPMSGAVRKADYYMGMQIYRDYRISLRDAFLLYEHE